MAAVPYIVSMKVNYADGYSESIGMTASDVNAQNWLGADGLAPIHLSGGRGTATIVDVLIGPGTGTDTRTATIQVNGKTIPEIVLLAACGSTVIGRQFQQSPLRISAGATMEFTQNT